MLRSDTTSRKTDERWLSNVTDVDDARSLAEWGIKRGLSRLRVGDVELEFREPTAEEVARDPYIKLEDDEAALLDEITADQRKSLDKKKLERMLFRSSV